MVLSHIIDVAKKKASQSPCHFKVSAVGFDRKGNIIGTSMNHPRFTKKGGGVHAEMKLMNRYGGKISTILICRVNKTGGLLPIDPCERCFERAQKLGIEIVSIEPNRTFVKNYEGREAINEDSIS